MRRPRGCIDWAGVYNVRIDRYDVLVKGGEFGTGADSYRQAFRADLP